MQLRLQVIHGRRITHKDLAKMAGASERAIAEWMRGATAPMAMSALMNLLARLAPKDAEEVLGRWRQEARADSHIDDGSPVETH